MLFGTVTLISGGHTTSVMQDEQDLSQSDPNLNGSSELNATEIDCIDATGAEYCEPIQDEWSESAIALADGASGSTGAALGYTNDEDDPEQSLPIQRGGFGHSSAYYSGEAV
jgi:hypothetical protein